jgi:hypothetical protein
LPATKGEHLRVGRNLKEARFRLGVNAAQTRTARREIADDGLRVSAAPNRVRRERACGKLVLYLVERVWV